MTKKRFFVAIPLPSEMREVLRVFQEEHFFEGIRWIAPENLHVTVFFCGDVEEGKIEELNGSIAEAVRGVTPFMLQWKEMLFAPPGNRPRMIWGEFYEKPEFADLVHKVHRAARPYIDPAIEEPRKKLIPHVTMARLREPRAGESTLASGSRRRTALTSFAPRVGVELQQIQLHNLEVKGCQLMDSELSPDGSHYTVVSTYAFT